MTGTGHVARTKKDRNAHRFLLGKPEGKRPLGRPRRKWVVGLREIGWSSMDWIDPAQDGDHLGALVNTVMNLPVP
jgi:hypothetical protein